jgi:prepilin-type processing-associated H-X9-DG protein
VRTFGIAAAVMAAGLILLGVFVAPEAPAALALGWVAFLTRVLPRLSPDGPTVAVSLAAVVLFTAGFHWLARTWRRHAAAQTATAVGPWRLRWSLAVVVLIFLMFTAGVAMIGVAHQLGWLLTAKEPLTRPALPYGSTSSHNLKYIGSALEQYGDMEKGRLPPGGTFTPEGSMLHSWETEIVPYLWYDSRKIDLKLPWNHPKNAEYFRSVIPEFINPELRGAPLTDAEGFGLSHYAANSHVLSANKPMRPQDVTDGTSTTLLIGEVNTGFKPWGHPVNWRDPTKGINTPQGFGGARSSGGANFVLVDGSVRFVSERVSPEVLKALSTPAGGEEIDADPPGVFRR